MPQPPLRCDYCGEPEGFVAVLSDRPAYRAVYRQADCRHRLCNHCERDAAAEEAAKQI